MELFLDALLDALIDGVKMLPFLYLAYLLIEWLERHHGESIEGALAGGGRWGFIPGALLGCVPQCGFSAVASNLYASRVITPGTLLAVFIAFIANESRFEPALFAGFYFVRHVCFTPTVVSHQNSC